ncbi:MAG TPA: glycoside hydrolase family 31 protein [Bacteroidales bacterium]|nr:MAG: Alpha-xylosidase [Bacteroidetes bacterium ADurb.BinA012]HNY57852.1 glycoside hydrolase family 31 protein [Bacteroidales bacterium]HPH74624.1 glycoside hydrolase family 31 protein [Bacteroidales bacterium]HPO40991.1 glycoside hydrolase family 31 protein [Bacteroidales bacterium]HPV26437.1 glycoside hydrolase family 31 protein [Bacteroidales bacterium]
MKMRRSLSALIPVKALIAALAFQSCSMTPYERTDNGVIIRLDDDSFRPGQAVRLIVVNERIIRVSSVPFGEFPETTSLMAVERPDANMEFTIEKGAGHVTLSTSLLSAEVSLLTGAVSFTDNDGTLFLTEKEDGGRSFMPVMAMGEKGYTIRQQFESYPDEAIYGLGANQTSFMNLKGKDADLFQYNTLAVVPFIISNRNYGILWDNNSRTKYGDIRDWNELSSLKLYDSQGAENGLTATYADRKTGKQVFTTRNEREISYQFIPDLAGFPEGFNPGEGKVTWEGAFETDTTGVFKFMFNSAGYARLWIDGRLLFDRWRQCWNASASYFTLNLEQGRRYPLKIEWIPDGGESYIALRYLTPLDDDEQQRISFWSEVADQIDYYFISGENMDEVISGYRTVTGKAPVMPEWAMGFWQSRQRYTNQEELLDVVREYRKRNIPFDNIVLDWQYWPADKWGDHQFDVTRFPDPDGMIRTLHDDLNARIMISVWPKYYVGTENYEAMKSKGYLYMRNVEMERRDWIGYLSTFYDAFNADARTAFWNQINIALYSRGIDAWWLDATEPDITSNLPMEERKAMMNPTALGSADRYFNAYSLVQAQGVYEGQRATDPENRVFILTRSAFAGLQRYSAANWSGDIAARWHDMAAQIPCGLNMSMSGIPWWTMDIGGFSVESRYHNPSPADLDEWRELMTRWHQYGAFVPLFRSHGEFPFREIYNTAPDNHIAYKTMVEYNRLRYRLMPYIYSLAGQAWLNDYTIMRGLTMDFSLDTEVFDIADQYMFGPSLMVNPVTEYKARSRNVYLPSAYGWYDVRTGRHYAGGTVIEADAPYEWMPLFAREGSLIPTGPDIQYTGEKEADPLTLWVYAGADGAFELYEDEGDNYNYEDGAYTLIPLTWNEAERTLTIGKREGEYRGMLHERTINVIMVSENRAVKLDFGRPPDKSVKYSGEEIKVRFE